MATYFTSDPHYGHHNVIGFCNRPFRDVFHMNETMISNWNDIVTPEDTVYILGDFSMSFHYVTTCAPRLLGNKILIAGNHDHVHSGHKKSNKPEKHANMIQEYVKYGLTPAPEEGRITLGNVEFKVSHFPFWNAEYKDTRYQQLRPKDENIPLLHGHVHQHWKAVKTTKGTVQINVGVDVWDYKPISEAQILETYEEALRNKP